MLFITASAGYGAVILLTMIGMKKRFTKIGLDEYPSVSVVVAARNEEKHISACLNALAQAEYPKEKIEFIIVDDQSSDNTSAIIDQFISGRENFRKLSTYEYPSDLRGKTKALALALAEARNEIIITTDADCTVPSSWINELVSRYSRSVGLVNAFSAPRADSLFSGMQRLDLVFIQSIAAGMMNLGMPISCIGNNMSFRKAAYSAAGGFEKLPFSVTEDFNLLKAIKRIGKYNTIYTLGKNSFVETEPCRTLRELYRQKKRWAVGGLRIAFSGFLVLFIGWLVHLCIALIPFFPSKAAVSILFFKILLDFIQLYLVSKELKISIRSSHFIMFELYFFLYVLLLPFSLLFSRKVIWKGRTY
jgi:cellulose synthase/poly-beta-1,6-N-acetylglucosamine synthase-like glycosyltransferase